MAWPWLIFCGASALLLVFAVITVVWAPGRRRDPGLREEDPPPDR